jgi:hypothetical protein
LLRVVIRLCAMHSTPGDKEQASGGEAGVAPKATIRYTFAVP